MKIRKLLSERLRTLREARGISQQDLAVKADLSMSQVSKLEQGKKVDPRVSTLVALATALGVSAGDLLAGLPPPKAPAADARPQPPAAPQPVAAEAATDDTPSTEEEPVADEDKSSGKEKKGKKKHKGKRT